MKNAVSQSNTWAILPIHVDVRDVATRLFNITLYITACKYNIQYPKNLEFSCSSPRSATVKFWDNPPIALSIWYSYTTHVPNPAKCVFWAKITFSKFIGCRWNFVVIIMFQVTTFSLTLTYSMASLCRRRFFALGESANPVMNIKYWVPPTISTILLFILKTFFTLKVICGTHLFRTSQNIFQIFNWESISEVCLGPSCCKFLTQSLLSTLKRRTRCRWVVDQEQSVHAQQWCC